MAKCSRNGSAVSLNSAQVRLNITDSVAVSSRSVIVRAIQTLLKKKKKNLKTDRTA